MFDYKNCGEFVEFGKWCKVNGQRCPAVDNPKVCNRTSYPVYKVSKLIPVGSSPDEESLRKLHGRGTGKTTAHALRCIYLAMSNPGKPIDMQPDTQEISQTNFNRMVERLIKTLNFSHLRVDWKALPRMATLTYDIYDEYHLKQEVVSTWKKKEKSNK